MHGIERFSWLVDFDLIVPHADDPTMIVTVTDRERLRKREKQKCRGWLGWVIRVRLADYCYIRLIRLSFVTFSFVFEKQVTPRGGKPHMAQHNPIRGAPTSRHRNY